MTADVVRVVLRGEPQPYRERASVHVKDGRAKIWSYRPQHVKTYQDHLRRAAEDAMDGRPLFQGAVELSVRAFMPMPKSMRKADRELAQLELLPHTKRPDLDGLIKAAKDAFKYRVWRDDALVAQYGRTFKVYSPHPRLELEVRQLLTMADAPPCDDVEQEPFVRFVHQGALL